MQKVKKSSLSLNQPDTVEVPNENVNIGEFLHRISLGTLQISKGESANENLKFRWEKRKEKMKKQHHYYYSYQYVKGGQ